MTKKKKKEIIQHIHDFCNKVETENRLPKNEKEKILDYIKNTENQCSLEFKFYIINFITMIFLIFISIQSGMAILPLIFTFLNYLIVKNTFKNTKEVIEICLNARKTIEKIGEKT